MSNTFTLGLEAHINTINAVLGSLFASTPNKEATLLRNFLKNVTDYFEKRIIDCRAQTPEETLAFVTWANDSLTNIVRVTISTHLYDYNLLQHLLPIRDTASYVTIINLMHDCKQGGECYNKISQMIDSLMENYMHMAPARINLVASVMNDIASYPEQRTNKEPLFMLLMNRDYSDKQVKIIYKHRGVYNLDEALCKEIPRTPLSFLYKSFTPEVMEGILQSYHRIQNRLPDTDPARILNQVPYELRTAAQTEAYIQILLHGDIHPSSYIGPTTPDTVCRDITRYAYDCKNIDDMGLQSTLDRWKNFTLLLDAYYRMKYPSMGPHAVWIRWKDDIRKHPGVSMDELSVILSMEYIQEQKASLHGRQTV